MADYIGNKISKIDISASTPTVVDVVTGLSNPIGVVLNGTDLFVSEFSGSKISKIDLTASTPTAVEVLSISGISPAFMALKVNDLYFADNGGNKVSKFDITASSPTVTDVVIGLAGPYAIAFNGDDLYITEYSGNKISKFDTSLSLSKISLESIVLYPNPTTDFIKISGLTKKENYKIYNVLGARVSDGVLSVKHSDIDVRALSSGLYFLKLSDRNTIKFLKE